VGEKKTHRACIREAERLNPRKTPAENSSTARARLAHR